ncbi:MAG: DUF4058 family protein [Gemmataceae bacterium]
MPLRDHFRPPVTDFASWEELPGAWPGIIAFRLNDLLPPDYRSGVKIHLGSAIEIDAGAFELLNAVEHGDPVSADSALAWKAASPTVLLDTDELTPPEYEVRVYDQRHSRRLVAAVEIVSPRNNDRPEARDAFVSKCHAMLQQDVCVVIVDPVTERSANLYADLAERIRARPPTTAVGPLYAVSCRDRRSRRRHQVQAWEHALEVGAPLPTLPLWISESQYVPLELERTYEETCKGLRIA